MSYVLCQVCGATNAPGADRCRRCGLPLLVVSGPQELDEPLDDIELEAQEEFEEHIFERLTTLEDSVRQLSRALGAAAERIGELEHQLTVTLSGVDNLSGLLEEHGVIPHAEIVSGWERRLDRELLSRDISRRFLERSQRILSQAEHTGSDSPEFRRRLRALELALLGQQGERVEIEAEALSKLAPENDELWSFIGEMAFEYGDLDSAKDAFERVLALRGAHFDTLLYLGTVLVDLGGWERAEGMLYKAHEMQPESFLPPFTIGALEVMRGDSRRALMWLRAALDREEAPQALYLAGLSELRLGHTGRAIDLLRSAVQAAPDFEDALYQLGIAYLRRGWSRRALRTFREVSRLDPQRLEYRETVRLLSLPPAEDLSPEVQGMVRRAETLLERGRPEAALDVYTTACRASGGEPALVAMAALLASAVGRPRTAVAFGHEVLRSESASDSPYLAAGAVALLEGLRAADRPRSARRVALGLLESTEDPLAVGLVTYELALVESELSDDLERARELALTALDTTPKELRHYPLAALGVIALRRGSYREAVRYLEQATEMAPLPTLFRQLAVARLETGDSSGAEQAFDAARTRRDGGLDEELLDHVRRLSRLRTVPDGRRHEEKERTPGG